MAKKKAARRKGGQNTSQPLQNQSATSSSNAPGSQSRPTPTLEALAPSVEAPSQADAATVPHVPTIPPEDDGFEVVQRRHRVARSQLERRTFGFTSDTPVQRPEYYYPDQRVNAYINYLFARLDEAVDDTRLDFYGILGEINRLSAQVEAAEDWDPPGDHNQEDAGDNTSDWGDASGWGDGDPGPSHAPARAEAPPLAISVDNPEHFPALGAPHRATHGHTSGSSQSGQVRWATIMQPRTARVPREKPRTSTPAVQVSPRNILSFVPPSLPPPSPSPLIAPVVAPPPAKLSQEELCKLAEDASVLLELYSKTPPDATPDVAQQLIHSAFAGVAKLNRHHRVLTSGSTAAQKRPENDDFTVDAGCIICYSEFADTVLLPCHHLVLCAVSLFPSFCCGMADGVV